MYNRVVARLRPSPAAAGGRRQQLRSRIGVSSRPCRRGDAAIDRKRIAGTAGNLGALLLALLLLGELSGCGRAQLQPAGPVSDAERKILLDSVVIMLAIVIPTICGALWDLTGKPWTAFVPLCLCAIALAVLGTVVTRRSPAVQAAHG